MKNVNNGLMIFEGESVEILFKEDVNIDFNGECLFNGKQICDLLMYSENSKPISRHVRDNQKIRLSNSNVVKYNFRKLHNTGETFLTEKGLLSLITECKTRSYKYKSNLLKYLNDNNFINNNIHITERKEIKFLDKLDESLRPLNLSGRRQYAMLNNKYRLDYFIPELNTAIEYDEHDVHKNYKYEKEEGRQKEIEKTFNTRFIRVSDKQTDEYNIGYIIKELIEGRYKDCPDCGYKMNIIDGNFMCSNCGYNND